MNYMQDALKKKKTITVSIDIDPDSGTAEMTPDEKMDGSEIMTKEDQMGEGEKEGNENKGMAPNSPEVEEESKRQIKDGTIEDQDKPMMSEEDIASNFQNDQPIGKPRSLQEALQKKAQSMK